jgi:putative hydrolase of the HAD superfamily
MAEYALELGIDPLSLQSILYEGELWRDVSVGKLTVDEFWDGVAEAIRRDAAHVRTALRDVWEPSRADEGVVELARALRREVRVALLSNATTGLEEHLERLGLGGLFDPVINSSRVGLRKPDPEVFCHALHVLDVPPQRVLFIDDKERNTVVAGELGIPSIVFESAEQLGVELARRGLLANVWNVRKGSYNGPD